MQIKKTLLISAALSLLLAGCATNRNSTGGMGSGTEQSGGSGNSYIAPQGRQAPTGPNGSIGNGNPFGLGPSNEDY